jgi:hypothetical protein
MITAITPNMTKGNILTIGLGSASIAMSRLFWIDTCFYVSEKMDSLENATCLGFKNAFLILGVIAVIIGIFGFFRNK